MDPSYKLRNLFLKTAKAINDLNEKEKVKRQIKIQIIKELEEEIFYLKENLKKQYREKKIKASQFERFLQKIKNLESEIKK